MSSACQCHVEGTFCFYCEVYSPLLAETGRLMAEVDRLSTANLRLDPQHIGIYGIADFDSVTTLQTDLAYANAENERLRSALERMDDRKHGMIPRSVMARIAKEALDYAAE